MAGSSGDRSVAQAPAEKPGGACQHFYIGDLLPPSREDGREMSVPARVHEQSRLTESDLLGRILCLPDDEMMVVKRRIESQSRSDADRMYLWREYLLQRDKLGHNASFRMSDAGVGQSSFETPTLVGGGLRSAHRHKSDMSATQAPLQQTQTGLSLQGEKRGRLDHEGLSANFGVVASGIPHAHSSSIETGFESGGLVGRAGVLGCNDFSLP